MTRFVFMALAAMFFAFPVHAQMIPYFIPNVQTLPPPVIGAADKLKTVAVLSAIGTSMTLENVHFYSLTGPKTKKLEITSWKIDEQAEAMIRQLLGSRFTFKQVSFDPTALARIPNGPLNNSRAAVRQILERLPKDDDLDAFIVLRPDLEPDTPGDEGLALVRDGDRPPVLWANYEIDVIDAHSLQTISRAYSRIQPRAGAGPFFAAFTSAGPGVVLDDNLQPNDAQSAELKAGLYALVPATVLATLRALKLSDAIPTAGSHALTPISPSPRYFPDIKTVAVMSAVGETLNLSIFTGFLGSRSSTQLAINDWAVDENLDTQLREILGQRFTIKDVAIDRQKLAQARLVDAKGAFHPNLPGLQPTDAVDAYVVVLKHPKKIGNSATDGYGIGLFNSQAVVGKQTGVFANLAIAVIKASTLEVMTARTVTAGPKFASPAPYLEVDRSLWPSTPLSLSAEQAERIHAGINEILSDSIAESLLQMQLTNMIIADSWSVASPSVQ